MSKKIIDERAILLLPSLAVKIGLNNAIFIQQLHFWLDVATELGYGVQHEGETWVYKTAEEWKNKDFPFWSVPTIRRIINDLHGKGIIKSQYLNDDKWNRTLYYRVDYSSRLLASDQVDNMQVINLITSKLSDCIDDSEITTKNTLNTKEQKNDEAINEILELWIPDLNMLNAWLQRSGEKAMTQNEVDLILLDVNSHYESQIKTGKATANKMYSNFVRWIKGDFNKYKKVKEQKEREVPTQSSEQKPIVNAKAKPKKYLEM